MFSLIKSVFKVIAKIVGTIIALEVVLTTIIVLITFKKEKKNALDTVVVSDDVQYRVVNAKGIVGIDHNKVRVACATKSTLGEHLVIITDEYLAMPTPIQEAILAHEEGHIALGHLETATLITPQLRSYYTAMGTVQPIELEADLYASKKVGTNSIINMLVHLSQLKGVNTKEISLRIDALKNQ